MARTITTPDEDLHIRQMLTNGATTAEIVEWLAARGLHRSTARSTVYAERSEMERDEMFHLSERQEREARAERRALSLPDWFPVSNPPLWREGETIPVTVYVPGAAAELQYQDFDYNGDWGEFTGRATHWRGPTLPDDMPPPPRAQ